MSDEKKLGAIYLPGIFAAAADEFLAAVSQGRILHKSRNIRDSGAPLEAAVRAFFSKRLPQSFLVSHGYLFDTDSNCTPQIDLIISPSQKSHVMLRAPEGATYSPFTDAYAIGEVKASGITIGKHLTQFAKQIRSVNDMWRSLAAHGGYAIPEITSFIMIGDSGDLEDADIDNVWKKDPVNFPDYIVLLNRGEIIMSPNRGLSAFFDEFEDDVNPAQQLSGSLLAAYAAGSDDFEMRGNALLWLFYAVLHRLRLSEAREVQSALTEVAASEGTPWDNGAKKAANILSRAADPFSEAMVRKIKLNRRRILSGRG